MGNIDFAGINQAALPQAQTLLAEWLPGGKLQGQEYVVLNPNRLDKSPGSFKVNVKTFEWGDFATGDRGRDLVSLYAFLNDQKQSVAARELAVRLSLDPAFFGIVAKPNGKGKGRKVKSQQWKPASHNPEADSKPIPHPKLGKPDQTWTYRSQQGQVLMYACRFDKPDGGKAVLPCTLREGPNGQREWRWKALPEPRPLYNLDRIAAMPDDGLVLIVEGEKAADAGQKLFPDYTVTTSPGGSKAAHKADWNPVKGHSVYLWPDADQAGEQYAKDVARLAHVAGASDVRAVKLPQGMPKGWDLADDLPEGWAFDQFAELLLQAEPLHPETETPETENHFAKHARKAGELMNCPRLPLDWTLKDSLLTRTTGLVVAAPGTGKSWFLMQMGAVIATGNPVFLGGVFKPGIKGTVAMLCAEDDERILQRRLLSIRDAFIEKKNTGFDFNPSIVQQDLEQNLVLLPVSGEDIRFLKNERGNFEKTEAFDALQAYLCSLDNLALVILDPLSRIHGADENDNNAGTLLVSLLERICRDTGASVIMAHHTSKGKGDQLLPNAGRGASAFLGAVRWQLNLAALSHEQAAKDLGITDPEGSYLTGRVSKKNYGPAEEAFYLHRGEGGVLLRTDNPREIAVLNEQQRQEQLIQLIIADLAAMELKEEKATAITYQKARLATLRKENPTLGITGASLKKAILQAQRDGRIITRKMDNGTGRMAEYLYLPQPEQGQEQFQSGTVSTVSDSFRLKL